jgi:hypothetical protein
MNLIASKRVTATRDRQRQSERERERDKQQAGTEEQQTVVVGAGLQSNNVEALVANSNASCDWLEFLFFMPQFSARILVRHVVVLTATRPMSCTTALVRAVVE